MTKADNEGIRNWYLQDDKIRNQFLSLSPADQQQEIQDKKNRIEKD